MVKKIKDWFIYWSRVLKDRCVYCGGTVWSWSDKKHFCNDCKKQQ